MNDRRREPALRLLLKRLLLRSTLGREEAGALLGLPGEVVSVRPHIDFVASGEQVEHSCLIADGLAARFEQLEDGRRQIIGLHLPGDLVDLYSLLLPKASVPLQTLCTSTIVKIPHLELRRAVQKWPNLGMALWRDSLIDGNFVAQAVVRLGRRDAFARVAHLLCEMALRYQALGAVELSAFRFPVTQEQLADTVGLTSVHVNRTLKTLREKGLVVIASGQVRILDWPGLQRAAAFDPDYLCLPGSQPPAGLVA